MLFQRQSFRKYVLDQCFEVSADFECLTGTIYGHSTRLMRASGVTLPYAWNHTTVYEEGLGHMPYLVQELQAQDLTVNILPDKRTISFTLDASIAPGEQLCMLCICVMCASVHIRVYNMSLI